ncbi:hypothetical protein JO83_00705 [Avibacterium paragallinarum]|uniref:DUF7675 family protein n=1 Tax=Avibacterium paragallinarum TaxID=728 RepID=UPI0010A9F961|nr:hypothetical protein JO83_00705 [Avibacterium paragallinarum]
MTSWYKLEETDKIWWKDNDEAIGEMVFSFDKEEEFNFWQDYPHKLTPEQKAIFDAENAELVRDLKGQS